jgi:Phytanoyl-CoA dioxygenase (PhyH)
LDFVRLQPEQRRAFEDDGFLVVRGALDAAAVARLAEAGDRRARAFLDKPELHGRAEYNHLDLRPGLLEDEALLALVAHPPTVSLVVQLLGPNIQLHSTALIYKRPEAPGGEPFRRGWHRDIRMARDLGHAGLPCAGLKVCYCLTDFPRPGSGMTLFARGSHLREEPLRVPPGEVDPADAEVCDLVLDAGDAVIFENRIFHTAAPNRSGRVSRVLMYGYAYRWLRPEVYLEEPDARLLARADPVTRQLLGGYRDLDTPPWALQLWAERHGVRPEPVPWTVGS